MRTRTYKTIRGLMRQMSYCQLSVDDVLSGSFVNKKGCYQNFRLTDEALREFTDGICGALGMRDKDDVFENIKWSRVKNCGIMRRIGVDLLRSGKLRYEYTAGQDYPSETRLVRKLLRCK